MVGYLVGTSIAVIGLYIAFALPIILRWRLKDRFETGAWSLGNHYKWIDPLAIIWIAFICVLFLMPITPTGIPWKSGFDWNVVNYAPITVGERSCSSAAGTSSRRTSGSRDRFGRARRKSSSGSNRATTRAPRLHRPARRASVGGVGGLRPPRARRATGRRAATLVP